LFASESEPSGLQDWTQNDSIKRAGASSDEKEK